MSSILEQLLAHLLGEHNKLQSVMIFFIICLMQIIYWLIKAR